MQAPLSKSRECGFVVPSMGKQGSSKFRAIVHGAIGTLACERAHQMGCISEQGYAWNPFPPVIDRQSVDGPEQWIDLTVNNQRGELRSPSQEFFRDMTQARLCVAGMEGSNPALWLLQRYIGLERPIGIAMRQDALARGHCRTGAVPDCIRACFVARVAVREEGFDEAGAGIKRLCMGYK